VIGTLHRTLIDRSIVIDLQRRLKHETIERFRRKRAAADLKVHAELVLLRMLSHQWHQYVRRDPTRTLFCTMSNTPRLDRTHGHAVVITAVSLGDGRFEVCCGGQLIVARTREPLLDGARALLAAGYHPDTIVVMRHAGSDVDVLTARIGTAARFYVEESGHGPVLRSVRKPPPGAVDRPPIAQTRPAGAEHRRGGRAGIVCRFDRAPPSSQAKKPGPARRRR
jgi:hypothetical protein